MDSLSQIQAFLKGMTLRQKFVLVVSAALVVGTLWLFVRLIGKADYKPLYSGLTASEAQSIARRLSDKNIPYELSSDGTSLRVPADQLDAIRLDMAAQGLPRSGRLGFELFDKPNWAGSDFAEKVNFQRALEGELERTIQTISAVEAVRVHLVLSRKSLFTEREREAKAAVMVKLRGRRLEEEAVFAITHLVSSAVDNLRPERVTVVNADGHVPLPVQGGSGVRGSRGLDHTLAKKLVATLAPVVGEDRVRASVTVEYDLSTSESTQETFDPARTVVVSTESFEERMTGAGPVGIPGTASNVPGEELPDAQAAAMLGIGEEQVQRSERRTFAVSKTTRHVLQPAGQVKRITAAVLIDDAVETRGSGRRAEEIRRKRTPEEMQQLEELARAAIGFDPDRGDFLSMQNLSFQIVPFEEPVPPTSLEKMLQLVERYMVVLRYLALGLLFILVYFLLLRPVKKEVLATFRKLPAQLKPSPQPKAALAAGATGGELSSKPDELTSVNLEQELNNTTSEVKRTVMLKRHLVDKVKKEPVGSSRLIQNWIRLSEDS